MEYVKTHFAMLISKLFCIQAVKLTSSHTQLPYEYYSLPFCQPEKVVYNAENLGTPSQSPWRYVGPIGEDSTSIPWNACNPEKFYSEVRLASTYETSCSYWRGDIQVKDTVYVYEYVAMILICVLYGYSNLNLLLYFQVNLLAVEVYPVYLYCPGEVLRGDRIVNTPYKVLMGEEYSCKVLCMKPNKPLRLSEKESRLVAQRILEEYYVHLWVSLYQSEHGVFLQICQSISVYVDLCKLGCYPKSGNHSTSSLLKTLNPYLTQSMGSSCLRQCCWVDITEALCVGLQITFL